MAGKKTKLVNNEFCRWFRKKVRDPLVKSALTQAQRDFINTTLPQTLFSHITRIESYNPRLAGSQKMNQLMSEMQAVLIVQGLKNLMPLVRQWAEQAVLYIYKDYFMEKFKTMGLHDWLEAFLNEDIDSDGDISGTPTKVEPDNRPETSPLFAPKVEGTE